MVEPRLRILIAIRFIKICVISAVLILQTGTANAQTPDMGQGRFLEYEHIAVAGLPEQRLTIWLPPGYDDGDRSYPVLYMHDGHNLFDPVKSNFNKVWAADKAMIMAAAKGQVEPHIIVGLWPPGDDRYRQYLPKTVYDIANSRIKAGMDRLAAGPVVSDIYLRWITDTLKPWLDTNFRTKTGAEFTAMAGSSMGGLMSCYAFFERPDIFGRAACVSTHWPLIEPGETGQVDLEALALWDEWLKERQGNAKGRRLWMDHGTATLDAHYPPYQAAINQMIANGGWKKDQDFKSKSYPGAEHEENAWAARLPEIFGWLLRKTEE